MPFTRIAEQSIAAFEESLSDIADITPTAFSTETLGQESSVVCDWHRDLGSLISLEHCLNGQWEKAWACISPQIKEAGLTRSMWEKQVWENLLSNSMLQSQPV